MIVFDLGCENSHRFEGWFASTAEFERQRDGQLLSCPLCGNTSINRLVTAARVNTGRSARMPQDSTAPESPPQYANFDSARLLKLITHIVENTEDVGSAFPEEARKIHYRESPERQIRGSASPVEVESLRDEGIEVVALPLPPHLANKSH
ncbi:MAG: DUF1178 family protein [Burkholderiales bacterium]|nr:DUF1178 family protein [Burkholderiales bacterium]